MRKRVFFIVILPLLLLAAFCGIALKPWFSADTASDASHSEMQVFEPEGAETGGIPMDFVHRWDLSNHTDKTLLMGDLEPDAFSLLEPAVWEVHFFMKDGKAHLESNCPVLHAKDRKCRVRTQYSCQFEDLGFNQMHPDGTVHHYRRIELICEVWLDRPFLKAPLHTFAVQNIFVDFVDGSADFGRPAFVLLVAGKTPHRFIVSSEKGDLPSRYCGSIAEQELTRLLFSLARIDSRRQAEHTIAGITEAAQTLVDTFAEADKAYPECWGEASDTARQLSRRIVPSLIRFRDNDCYNCQALADFVNSPVFARCFGESFADAPEPLPDAAPIIFEKNETGAE